MCISNVAFNTGRQVRGHLKPTATRGYSAHSTRPLADMWCHSQFSNSHIKKHILTFYVGKSSCQSKEGPIVAICHKPALKRFEIQVKEYLKSCIKTLGYRYTAKHAKHLRKYTHIPATIVGKCFPNVWANLSNGKYSQILGTHLFGGKLWQTFAKTLKILNIWQIVGLVLLCMESCQTLPKLLGREIKGCMIK